MHPWPVRSVAIGALVVSIVIGLMSDVLFLAAFQFRSDWFMDPARVLGAGTASAAFFKWASVTDLVGYYLASGVLAYALWRILRPRNPTVADLSATAAVAFMIAGGVGAAVLAMVGPMLMLDHAAATNAADRVTIGLQFDVLLEIVWRSIWQLLDGILLASWWLGIGLLVRPEQPGLSRLSLLLAAAAVIGVLFNVLSLDLARDAALGVVFALWTAWWVWLLVLFIRRRAPFAA